ncbi:unnamed protein product [Anisakis simplex]|uniref:UBA domain-containing protein n=1 Tax=Anisakis simplex TaxID=6269 RepID=A0A0M3JUH6_ANISI|nr:unnamed protein product [Anisakis simplex]
MRPDGFVRSGLVFLGKIIADDEKLCDVNGLKSGSTVYLMRRPQMAAAVVIEHDAIKLEYCRKVLSKLRLSRSYRLKVVRELARDDLIEHLSDRVPTLKDDIQACAALRDYVLIGWLLDEEDETFIKAHPVIVEAIYQLFCEIIPVRSAQSPGERDVEMAQDAPSTPTGPAPIITSQMLQEAMEQVFRTMNSSSANGSTGNASTSASNPLVAESSTSRFSSEMAELSEFGFTDLQQNIRALEETGGDVQQAIELLIALRESLSGDN